MLDLVYPAGKMVPGEERIVRIHVYRVASKARTALA